MIFGLSDILELIYDELKWFKKDHVLPKETDKEK